MTERSLDLRATRIADRIGQSLSFVAGVGVVVLMVCTVADVALRFLTGRGLDWVVEASEVALVAIAFLGMMGASQSNTHARTSLVTSALPARLGSLVRSVGTLVAFVFLAWVSVQTWAVAAESYLAGEYRFGLTRVPVWPARFVVALGLTAFAIAVLVELMRRLARHRARLFADLQEGSLPDDFF